MIEVTLGDIVKDLDKLIIRLSEFEESEALNIWELCEQLDLVSTAIKKTID